MDRYTERWRKLERREGVSLDLKGKRQLRGKTALERRGAAPPGQPQRQEIAMPVTEQLVIERYARR